MKIKIDLTSSTSVKHFETLQCVYCGDNSVVSVDLSDFNRWQSGEYIQTVWPQADADIREIMISGTHPRCWDKMFKEESNDV